MKKAGLIPLMSCLAHPIAVLHSCNTCRMCSTCTANKLDEIIIGKIELGPKKAYPRRVGSGLRSNYGGSTIGSFAGDVYLSSKYSSSN